MPDMWIIVWWRLAHVLQTNLEGQCARSWPGRMQFKQSLFLIKMFFRSRGEIATNCGHSARPVSYTHLDVYKRQV